MSTLILPKPSTQPDLYHGKWVAGLFASGEQGVWYDPSDFSTMFQDAAGTTPVTAVEQPVGLILDKSKGLVLGAELIPDPTFSGWADPSVPDGWTKTGTHNATNYMQSSSGGLRIVSDGTYVSITVGGLTVGRSYEVKFDVTARVSGAGVVLMGAGTDKIVSAVGAYKIVMVANSTSVEVKRHAACDITFDNISVRELPGNHAYQSTSASRPVLSARVNLLTKTEQFDDAAWVKVRASITSNATVAHDGTLTADKLVEDTTASASHFTTSPSSSYTSGTSYTFSIYAKKGERDQFGFNGISPVTLTDPALFNLSSGVVISSGSFTDVSITPVGNGWYRCVGTIAAISTGSAGFIVRLASGESTFYTGDGTSGIYIWGADLRVANDGANLPPYQRVNTATDYDTAGFPHYLRFDGVDDYLVTGSIDFTATDKMTVFAGVRKLRDAASGSVCELSNDSGASMNAGVFMISAPPGDSNGYFWRSKGTSEGYIDTASPAAPVTNVVTGIGDISGDSAVLRLNGSQAGTSTADQGSGNYGNFPLYIGRRGGTKFPFNGHLYGLIVRGAQTDDAHLTHAEKYLAYKSGVTL